MRGVLSVSGVIGTWAGPRSAGTAYVMAHHQIGDIGDGALGAWGFPEGGWAPSRGPCARRPSPSAPTSARMRRSQRIVVRDGRATGVVTDDGRGDPR